MLSERFDMDPRRLKFMRKKKKLSQERFAELVGVCHRAVQNWESGETGILEKNLIRVMEVLGCRPEDIMRGGEGDATVD